MSSVDVTALTIESAEDVGTEFLATPDTLEVSNTIDIVVIRGSASGMGVDARLTIAQAQELVKQLTAAVAAAQRDEKYCMGNDYE